VGCLRRLQYWNLTSILEEMRAFGSSHFSNEQFIELFDIDLITLPKHLPDWFISQQLLMNEEKRHHPTFSQPQNASTDSQVVEEKENKHCTRTTQ